MTATRLSLAAALVFAASLSTAASAPRPSTEATRLARAIDAFAAPLLARDQLSGQLLVARHDTVLIERQWGYADWELRAPVTTETRFCIASVTKPMTGTVAIHLMETKALGYHDSLAKWLPGFPNGDRITIADLLGHRSGIPHELIPDSEATRPFTPAAMTAIAAHRPLDFPPGSKSQYSSGGFSVLARILELASGHSYAQLLREQIFEPLGMTHSSDHDSRALLADRAHGVIPGAHGLENAPYEDFSHIVGAGSVWSTARDLHRFVQGIVTGRLGAGVERSYLRRGTIDFNGLVSGFRAFCDFDSASGIEVIYVGNLSSGAADLVRAAIPKLAAGAVVPPPTLPALAAAPADSATLAAYRGTYLLENGTRLVVRDRDGVLWSNDWVLLPLADGGFFSPRDYGVIHGVMGSDGRIARLDWLQRGTTYPAPRVAETTSR